ncbi:MAG: HAD-IC family P-type ATPase [Candidatus Pacebacteria bacterium]|nr:HAD-IC family P-type ATPase [Candidatus Paceibacterota bacterium]
MNDKIIWHNLSKEDVLKSLQSDIAFGLDEDDAAGRQKKYGKNSIPEKKKTPEIVLFLKQFSNPLIYLIFLAAVFSLFLQKFFDAGFILLVILITGSTAYFQERKTSKIMEELKKIVKIKAMVQREGSRAEVDSEELVPGDVVFLKPGDKVPADGRIIEAGELEVNEMALTGEWISSKKQTEPLPKETVLADRENMVYMGTIIENGSGKAVITETGRNTELGEIAVSLQEKKEKKTLLEKRLLSFSRYYGVFVFSLLVLIFLLGIIRKIPIPEFLITVVATGVSAIPEGLLPAVTVILVVGMKRILRKKGLVRKLSNLETLGSTQIILTDKTGTLTEGKMKVVKIMLGEEFLGKAPKNHDLALKIAGLANEAFIENADDAMKDWIIRGKPTAKALLEAAVESGIDVEKLRKESVKIEDSPFNSVRKYYAVIYEKKEEGKIIYAIGAPEKILGFSNFLRVEEKEEKLDENGLGSIRQNLENFTGKGFRVLGFGYKKIRESDEVEKLEDQMENLVFTGLFVLQDPLRENAKQAIGICRRMGIKPVIVTGDHLLTAKAIAEELALEVEEENIIEGKDLDLLNDKDFSGRIEKINVFARIDPIHKSRIVNAWQEKGMVVAMTGDGINDAPALRKADVGLALGSGTDLAKETSDLILLDDNFLTIVSSIEEGRGIFDRIRNTTVYLVSNDFTELGFILTSVLFGFPLPLLATQILWINVIEDSAPAISLTLEKREKETLAEKPRPRKEGVLNSSTRTWMLSIGLVTVAVELVLFLLYLKFNISLEKARTVLLAVTTVETFYLAFSHRSLRRKIIRKDIFSNSYLNGSVLLGAFLLAVGIYNPIFQKFLHTVSLNSLDWFFVIICVFAEAAILETIKGRIFIK